MKCITRCYINLAETRQNASGGTALVVYLVIDFILFFCVFFVSLDFSFVWFVFFCFSALSSRAFTLFFIRSAVMEAVAPIRLSRWGLPELDPESMQTSEP